MLSHVLEIYNAKFSMKYFYVYLSSKSSFNGVLISMYTVLTYFSFFLQHHFTLKFLKTFQ